MPGKVGAERKWQICNDNEALAHVLCFCSRNLGYVQGRRNGVGALVWSAITLETPNSVIFEKTCDYSSGQPRVDFQVEIIRKKQLWLVDIKTAFDTMEEIDRCRKENVPFHENLRKEILA